VAGGLWLAVRALGGAGLAPEHLRHVPLPRLSPGEEEPPGELAPAPLAGAGAGEVLGTVPGRVAALLALRHGEVWAGTFDRGLWIVQSSGAPALGPLTESASPFVNALARHGREVLVATAEGVDRRGLDGRLLGRLLQGAAVTSLLSHQGRLYLGTSKGVAVWDGRVLDLAGPGAPASVPAVHALAADGDDVLVGTASGVCLLDPGLSERPQCRSLLFGSPPLGSAWVNALASTAAGPFVLSDTGGAARLDGVRLNTVWRLSDPALDRYEPGAAAALPDGRVAAATQGRGVLLLGGRHGPLRWTAGPQDVTALAVARDGALLAGTASGAVLRLAADRLKDPR